MERNGSTRRDVRRDSALANSLIAEGNGALPPSDRIFHPRTALEAAVHRYVDLFDFAPVGYVSFDRFGKIEEVNFAAAQLLSRSRERLLGRMFVVFVTKGQSQIFLNHLHRCHSSHGRVETELNLRRAEGEIIPVQLSSIPLASLMKDGARLYQTAIVDLTERQRAENNARENETRLKGQKEAFQLAIDKAPLEQSLGALIRVVNERAGDDFRAAFYIVDKDGTRLHPVFADGSMSESYMRQVDGFKVSRNSVSCGLAVATGRRILTPNVFDEPRWKPWLHLARKFDFRACWSFPIETRGAKPLGTFAMYHREAREATARDLSLASAITQAAAIIISQHTEAEERKRAEGALRESEELHRALVSQTAVGMSRSDLKGRFTFVNKTFGDILGYKQSELVGKKIVDVTHPDDVPVSRKLFRRLIEKGQAYHYEKRYVRKNGSQVWVNVSASPMRNASGEIHNVIAVIRDISVRKQAQAKLETARQLLETRVAERTSELVSANQELQNEIAMRKQLEGEILTISDREQRRLGQDLHDSLCQHLAATAFMTRAMAERVRGAKTITPGEIEKIATLINEGVVEARNIARGLHPVEMDAAGLPAALRTLCKIDPNRVCRAEISDDLPDLDHVVATHLYRIAREAVINANKHARAREVCVRMRRLPKEIELSVTDDGIGLGEKRGDGTGMGFHIMSYRARSIGARLEITGVKPHGTRVACHLPYK